MQAEGLWASSGGSEFVATGARVTSFGLASPGGVPCAVLGRLTSQALGAKSGAPKRQPDGVPAPSFQQVGLML